MNSILDVNPLEAWAGLIRLKEIARESKTWIDFSNKVYATTSTRMYITLLQTTNCDTIHDLYTWLLQEIE